MAPAATSERLLLPTRVPGPKHFSAAAAPSKVARGWTLWTQALQSPLTPSPPLPPPLPHLLVVAVHPGHLRRGQQLLVDHLLLDGAHRERLEAVVAAPKAAAGAPGVRQGWGQQAGVNWLAIAGAPGVRQGWGRQAGGVNWLSCA